MGAPMEMKLDIVAATLEGLEDTIIFKLLDRAQFAVNRSVYLPGLSGFESEQGRSLFEIRLRWQEEMDSQFGRFIVPEEMPFTKGLPSPKRRMNLPDTGLCSSAVNKVDLTPLILERYHGLLENICRSGDDGHYGSSVEHDIYALQALSRRIHYGSLYVAECKYRENRQQYQEFIHTGNRAAILELLTRKEVEERIIGRVRDKLAYAQEHVNETVRTRIDPEIILTLYRDTVIPLTKEGEVAYLLSRTTD